MFVAQSVAEEPAFRQSPLISPHGPSHSASLRCRASAGLFLLSTSTPAVGSSVSLPFACTVDRLSVSPAVTAASGAAASHSSPALFHGGSLPCMHCTVTAPQSQARPTLRPLPLKTSAWSCTRLLRLVLVHRIESTSRDLRSAAFILC